MSFGEARWLLPEGEFTYGEFTLVDVDRDGEVLRACFASGRFQPLTVEGQTLGNFEVPTGAFSWDGHLYVFVARNKREDPSRMTTSTLVVRHASQWDFRPVLQISSTTGGQILVLHSDGSRQPAPYPGRRWMLHISPTVVANADWPGLPSASGHGLLMFGASAYRGTAPDVTATELVSGNVYLAWAPLTAGVVPPHSPIPPADQWQFFNGVTPSETPKWSTLSASVPIPVISNVPDGPRLLGELGVVWYPELRRWVMAGTGRNDPWRACPGAPGARASRSAMRAIPTATQAMGCSSGPIRTSPTRRT